MLVFTETSSCFKFNGTRLSGLQTIVLYHGTTDGQHSRQVYFLFGVCEEAGSCPKLASAVNSTNPIDRRRSAAPRSTLGVHAREALGEHLGIGARRVRRRRRSDQVKPAPVHRRPRKDRHNA